MRDQGITHKVTYRVRGGRILAIMRMRCDFKLGGKVSRIFKITDIEALQCTNDLSVVWSSKGR